MSSGKKTEKIDMENLDEEEKREIPVEDPKGKKPRKSKTEPVETPRAPARIHLNSFLATTNEEISVLQEAGFTAFVAPVKWMVRDAWEVALDNYLGRGESDEK